MKRTARQEWIDTMVEYYEAVFPNTPRHFYYKWAESTVDYAASELKDYFSFSMWRH